MKIFVCRSGTFKIEVMPFGLVNAPSTFQRMMYYILRAKPFARVYLDDAVVFSNAMVEHVEHLYVVLEAIDKAGFKLKITKCAFSMVSVTLLVHYVYKNVVRVDEAKINAIKKAPVPCNATELRSFLGLVGYYRRFITYFAAISAVLQVAISGTRRFKWTEEMKVAFENLNE